MIYVTGDIHAEPGGFSTDAFPEQKNMTKKDFVVICGDFGLIWEKEESPREKYWLDWLEEKPFTTLVVDGNHENHDRIFSMKVSEWHGGNVHRFRPSVIHLMRGEIYEVDGKSIFSFGGANSHDIWNLLNPNDPDFKRKKKEFDRDHLFYRVIGESWWEREMPTVSEMEHAKENLAAHGNKVDYIFTHEMPQSDFMEYYRKMGGKFWMQNDNLRIFLDEIKNSVSYKYWFCGHHHDNVQLNGQDFLLYEQIVKIV